VFRFLPCRGADRGVIAASSDSSQKSSYQLQRYTNSPRRHDPYTPGHGDHRDTAASLAELDMALSSLQKGGNASKL
jgi:hypothetical protein